MPPAISRSLVFHTPSNQELSVSSAAESICGLNQKTRDQIIHYIHRPAVVIFLYLATQRVRDSWQDQWCEEWLLGIFLQLRQRPGVGLCAGKQQQLRIVEAQCAAAAQPHYPEFA